MKTKVFIENGLVIGVFSDSEKAEVEIVDYDSDLDSRTGLDREWERAKASMSSVAYRITHPSDEEEEN